jgi:hypothetical protein
MLTVNAFPHKGAQGGLLRRECDMEPDPAAWVVHRHVIEAFFDDGETWSARAVPTPLSDAQPDALPRLPELVHDLGRHESPLDGVPVLASPGALPSPGGGPSPAL